ncbi:MAG TPA: metallopeptidase TldD-related protein [Terracidiphilus sp.]|nr:metallopeptidase TldD-related protein [Terracidiphilus sp.]
MLTPVKNMRIAVASLLLAALACALPARAQDDVVMKAMRDELDRSMNQLQLENLEKPYFIAYRVVDSESTGVSASFGALDSSNQGRGRRITVEVRVGSYQLDNTNFFSFTLNMSSMVQAFNGTAELPLDDDYNELRRQIWLVTDATYKKAVEDLSKKRAALENKVDSDRTPDFSRETPTQTAITAAPIHVDRAQWETEARNLSALFRSMPGIYTSGVSFSAVNAYVRYVNSEGTWYTREEPRVTFNARANTQAADGAPLEDSTSLYAQSLDGLPDSDALAARLHALGQRLQDLRASTEIQSYNGPVLAEGDAAAQLFRTIFLPNLLGVRRPMMDTTMGLRNTQVENPFLDKIGGRVLPDFLSVTDNPTLAELNGKPLAGTCKVDEDGVATRETLLVDKGILKTLLTTRDPVRGIEHSTGSRHDGQAAPSNVIVTANNGLSQDDLRAKFLALLKQENKEYGIVLRRMRTSGQPITAFKMYQDGHEELIHGVQLSGLNAAAFKDIVAASKEQNMQTVEFRPEALMSIMSFGDEGFAPVTLAVPSLLFDDVTVRKLRGETSKPPIVPSPYAGGN